MTQALFLVALILGIIELIRSRGESLIAWAVSLIALGLTLPLLRSF
jgi:hypothetical protein